MKPKQSKLVTRLFEREGKENLTDTIGCVVKAAAALDIRRVVVFTSDGEAALRLRRRLPDQREIFAVTFPHEMVAKPADRPPTFMGIPSRDTRTKLAALGISIVQGTMPFRVGPESDAFNALRYGFGIFGGGAQLCVQAVLMACDAGHLDAGERCLVMSADTGLIMRAGHSWQFFQRTSTAAVEHIVCKPLYYQISRTKQELEIASFYSRQLPENDEVREENVTPKTLPLASSEQGEK